jgi:uncharacterized membrane protein YeaQ/YmgE (transglycosylase-associated protein family)
MDLSMPLLGYSILGWIVLLAVAAICGAIGQAFAGYSAGGCLLSLVIGLIGSWLGAWLAVQLGLPEIFTINVSGQPFPIVWSIIGAALFAIVLSLVTQRLIVDM